VEWIRPGDPRSDKAAMYCAGSAASGPTFLFAFSTDAPESWKQHFRLTISMLRCTYSGRKLLLLQLLKPQLLHKASQCFSNERDLSNKFIYLECSKGLCWHSTCNLFELRWQTDCSLTSLWRFGWIQAGILTTNNRIWHRSLQMSKFEKSLCA
jgi:hypothetical protein